MPNSFTHKSMPGWLQVIRKADIQPNKSYRGYWPKGPAKDTASEPARAASRLLFEYDGGNGCARFSTLPNHLEFELGTVKPPRGDFGASSARHGVHDLHRAHCLRKSAST
jgi:hypothetical protein